MNTINRIPFVISSLFEMIHDSEEAHKLLKNTPDSQFMRRTYIKGVFSFFEGTTSLIKDVCIAELSKQAKSGLLTVGEKAILNEESYELETTGTVKVKQKILKLPANLRFAINTFNKLFGTSISLGTDTDDWKLFILGKDIRNRITHPKKKEDLKVSDQDIELCDTVVVWFQAIAMHVYDTLLLEELSL